MEILILVYWEEVCTLRDRGGLGVKNLAYYDAFLLKIAWKLLIGSNYMWSIILKLKYFKGSNFFIMPKATAAKSLFERKIYKL